LESGGIAGIIGAEDTGSGSVKKIVLRSLLFWVLLTTVVSVAMVFRPGLDLAQSHGDYMGYWDYRFNSLFLDRLDSHFAARLRTGNLCHYQVQTINSKKGRLLAHVVGEKSP
jgi:hypothetical protein